MFRKTNKAISILMALVMLIGIMPMDAVADNTGQTAIIRASGALPMPQRPEIGNTMIAAGGYHTLGLRFDGSVLSVGSSWAGPLGANGWTDIVSIAAGGAHTVGLKSDGTVVAVGSDWAGQLEVNDWTDVVAIAAGSVHTVGLKSDGTVLAVGDNGDGQLEVNDWTDIIAISAGIWHTVGLKTDGTVLALGSNWVNQLDVQDWTDIVAIAVGAAHIVGLKSDGTVLAVGTNGSGQLEVNDWTDIVAIAAGNNHTVGLKSDGTVVAVGYNEDEQLDISDWTDIVSIAAGNAHTVGLKSDGTVIAAGSNTDGQLDVYEWQLRFGLTVSASTLHQTGGSSIVTVLGSDHIPITDMRIAAFLDNTGEPLYMQTLTENGGSVSAVLDFPPNAAMERIYTVRISLDGGNTWLMLPEAIVTVHGRLLLPMPQRPELGNVMIAAGVSHIVGLRFNGTVVAAGTSNVDGQLDVNGWTDIVAIAAGRDHTVGLKSDGTVLAVGRNWSGQLNVYNWTDIVAISAGDSHTVGLKSDGTVVSVGSIGGGELDEVSSWMDIVAIAAGSDHALGLKSDGTVVAVGSIASGHLGDVSSWTDIVAIAAGRQGHTVGLKSDGTVVVLGSNWILWDFQLEVSGWTDISAIAATGGLTVGLKSDGTVLAITSNGFSQLEVSGWADIVAVYDGALVGLKSDGTVLGLAVGTYSSGHLDVQDWRLFFPVTDITTSHSYFFHNGGSNLITARGRYFFPERIRIAAFLDDDMDSPLYMQTPTGNASSVSAYLTFPPITANTTVRYTIRVSLDAGSTWLEEPVVPVLLVVNPYPMPVPQRPGIGNTMVSAGGAHTVGLKSDGTVVAVGGNLEGQLNVSGWTDIVAIAAGAEHTVGLKSDGTVVVTGSGWNVGGWTDVVAIAAGVTYTVGLRADGTVLAVGKGWNVSIDWTDIVAISAGGNHIVGLRSNGTVAAAGENSSGQLGVFGWTDIVAISAGYNHTVGLKPDGSMVAVGANDFNQIDIGGLTGIIAVSAGYNYSLALKADGTVVAVGSPYWAAHNELSGWTDIVAISLARHAVGLKSDGTVVAAGGNGGQEIDVLHWDLLPDIRMTANPRVISHIGGNSIITLSGEDFIPANMRIAAFLNNTGSPLYIQTPTGTSTVVSTTITFPENTGNANRIYTIKFSTDSGSTWAELPRTSVTVRSPQLPMPQRPEPGKMMVDAGDGYTVGLRVDGTVVGAGANWDGRLNVSDWTEIVAIAAGGNYTAGLKTDGTVVAVGYVDYGQLDVSGWANIVAIAAGYNHIAGLKSDGTVVAVGSNTNGQLNVGSWANIVAIAAGSAHTVGLKSDGTVIAIGDNSNGQCNVNGWTDIVAIAAGGSRTAGIRADGTVLRASSETDSYNVSGWTDISKIAVGNAHIAGLKSDGTVIAVGSNNNGQLDITGWTDISAIAAGNNHTVGLKPDGTVLAVGFNGYGQLDVTNWQLSIGVTNVTDISAISRMIPMNGGSSAIIATGVSLVPANMRIAAFLDDSGDPLFRQTPTGNTSVVSASLSFPANTGSENREYTIRVSMDGGTTWPETLPATTVTVYNRPTLPIPQRPEIGNYMVAAGVGHTVGLKYDGTMVAVGDNQIGQLNVSDWTDIVAITAGNYHTVGLRSNGTAVAVGWNNDGQLNVSGWTDIVAITAGYAHTVGLRSNGTVVAVGRNNDGQLSVSGWTDIVAITAGEYHTVGLRSNGTVVAVGRNSDGQLNVSDWTDIVAITAGEYHTVGLRSNGTVVAVGDSDGQLYVSDWTDIVAVAAGTYNTVGLRSNGTVVAVGQPLGYLDVDIVAVTVGRLHAVGLRPNGTVVAVGINTSGQLNVQDWLLAPDIRLTANPATFSHNGGRSTVTITSDAPLPDNITIAAFLNDSGEPLYMQTPTGEAFSVNADLIFPPNIADTEELVYTIRFSEDGGDTWYRGSAATVRVAVPNAIGVSLNRSTITLPAGETTDMLAVPLRADVVPRNAGDQRVTWSSSNTAVASVSSSGVVTAHRVGEAVITATTTYGGFTDSATVFVTPTIISSESDLNRVRNNPSGHYELANDIALTGSWTPIGSQGSPFTGIFNGNGNMITGVNVDTGSADFGLFGYVGTTGRISDLGVEYNSRFGGVAGRNDGEITGSFTRFEPLPTAVIHTFSSSAVNQTINITENNRTVVFRGPSNDRIHTGLNITVTGSNVTVVLDNFRFEGSLRFEGANPALISIGDSSSGNLIRGVDRTALSGSGDLFIGGYANIEVGYRTGAGRDTAGNGLDAVNLSGTLTVSLAAELTARGGDGMDGGSGSGGVNFGNSWANNGQNGISILGSISKYPESGYDGGTFLGINGNPGVDGRAGGVGLNANRLNVHNNTAIVAIGGAGGNGGSGGNGGGGQHGGDGGNASSYNNLDKTDIQYLPGGHGGYGGRGGNGGDGGRGGNGGDAITVLYSNSFNNSQSSHIQLTAGRGGNGGQGGQGGRGGNGGNGGKGFDAILLAFKGGPGGAGGNGGDGGNGGMSGGGAPNGALVRVGGTAITDLFQTHNFGGSTLASVGGAGGNAGNPGPGGKGNDVTISLWIASITIHKGTDGDNGPRLMNGRTGGPLTGSSYNPAPTLSGSLGNPNNDFAEQRNLRNADRLIIEQARDRHRDGEIVPEPMRFFVGEEFDASMFDFYTYSNGTRSRRLPTSQFAVTYWNADDQDSGRFSQKGLEDESGLTYVVIRDRNDSSLEWRIPVLVLEPARVDVELILPERQLFERNVHSFNTTGLALDIIYEFGEPQRITDSLNVILPEYTTIADVTQQIGDHAIIVEHASYGRFAYVASVVPAPPVAMALVSEASSPYWQGDLFTGITSGLTQPVGLMEFRVSFAGNDCGGDCGYLEGYGYYCESEVNECEFIKADDERLSFFIGNERLKVGEDRIYAQQFVLGVALSEVTVKFRNEDISAPIRIVINFDGASILPRLGNAQLSYVEGDYFDPTGLIIDLVSKPDSGVPTRRITNLSLNETWYGEQHGGFPGERITITLRDPLEVTDSLLGVEVRYDNANLGGIGTLRYTIPITVVPLGATHLEIIQLPEVNYIATQNLDLADLIVDRVYNNGDRIRLQSGDYTIANANGDIIQFPGTNYQLTADDLFVTITCRDTGVSVNLQINVVPVEAVSAEVVFSPTRTNYLAGESLNLAGFQANVRYNTGNQSFMSGNSITDGQIRLVNWDAEESDEQFTGNRPLTVNDREFIILIDSISLTFPLDVRQLTEVEMPMAQPSPESGDIARGTEVTLFSGTDGATIWYTLDGSEPTAGNHLVFDEDAPIVITEPTTVKARAFKDEWWLTGSGTAVYSYGVLDRITTDVDDDGLFFETFAPQTVTIANAETHTIEAITIELFEIDGEPNTDFILSRTSVNNLQPGESGKQSFTITPRSNLPTGLHYAIVLIGGETVEGTVFAVGMSVSGEITGSFGCPVFLSEVKKLAGISPTDPLMNADIESITELSLSDMDITSLAGIEFFTSLQRLDVSGNLLTEINLSENRLLTYIDVSNNQLTSLDISRLSFLGELYATHNAIAGIDVSGNAALTRLHVAHNAMAGADSVSGWRDLFEADGSTDEEAFWFWPQTGIINAQTPIITGQPQSATVTVGTVHSLTIEASVTDGGELTYQWYSNASASNAGGTIISDATDAAYAAPIDTEGTYYYYVVVTNTNNSVSGSPTATATSNAATLTVSASAQTYSVAIAHHSNGSIAAYPTTAEAGTTIMLTVTPDDGYQLKPGTLQYNGNPIAGNSFTMPAANVTVTAEFEPILLSDALTFMVGNATKLPGQIVEIPVFVVNNFEGLEAITVNVNFDDTRLEWLDKGAYESSDTETHPWQAGTMLPIGAPGDLSMPLNFVDMMTWDICYDEAGILIILQFKVKDDAPLGDAEISLEFSAIGTGSGQMDVSAGDYNNISGIVTVSNVVYGKFTGDGPIDIFDVLFLARSFFGWSGYDIDITEAADVDGNGIVDIFDVLYLARHFFGWAGYEVLGPR